MRVAKLLSRGVLFLGGLSVLGSLAASAQTAAQSTHNVAKDVLIVGGGTSHDFRANYQRTDAATLREAGFHVRYTESFAAMGRDLQHASVVLQTSNQTSPVGPVRQDLVRFVAGGGGLVVLHAGAWYNWADWPQYNRALIGGGTREHDKFGTFVVNVVEPQHPVMAGVALHFTIEDELYHEKSDGSGGAVEVLATARSPHTGETYPIVWVVKGQGGRIVCMTLGHDDAAHTNAAYRQLLTNAVRWTTGER